MKREERTGLFGSTRFRHSRIENPSCGHVILHVSFFALHSEFQLPDLLRLADDQLGHEANQNQ
jgi:hypothetical protein